MKKLWYISIVAIILVVPSLSVSFSTQKSIHISFNQKDTLILLPDVNNELRTCCDVINDIRNGYYREHGIEQANKQYLGCMTRCYGKHAADSLLKILLENEKTGKDTADEHFWKRYVEMYKSAVKASHDYLYWKQKKCGVRLADSAFHAMISKAKEQVIITSRGKKQPLITPAQYDSIVAMSARNIKTPVKFGE